MTAGVAIFQPAVIRFLTEQRQALLHVRPAVGIALLFGQRRWRPEYGRTPYCAASANQMRSSLGTESGILFIISCK